MKKRVFSILIALCMVLTFMPTVAMAGSSVQTVDVWDGRADTSWYDSSKTSFEISTAKQLAGLASLVNDGTTDFSGKTIKLTSDIDLNNKEWTPIGKWIENQLGSKFFTGTFDGNGKTVSNLYIKSNENQQGLFGLSKGTIKNLTVSGCICGDGEENGGIIGSLYRGTIEDCYNKVSISGNGLNRGGICGKANFGTIKRCVNEGNITGKENVGGIVGISYVFIENCYNVGTVTGSSAGGICGYNYNTIKYCYSTIFGEGEKIIELPIVGKNDTEPATGEVKNSFYLGNNVESEDVKTQEQFKSGEVTYLLQEGQSDQSSQIWGQYIGEDQYPILTKESNKKVYEVTFVTDAENTKFAVKYANYNNTVEKLATNPTKSGYEFDGWYNVDTESDVTDSITVRGDITVKAKWKDVTPPTGKIKLGNNIWNTLLSNIAFNTFLKDNQTVTITASDNSGEAVTISYLLSDKALSKTELESASFTAYNAALTINSEGKYVIYAKLTDSTGNTAYISSDGFVIDKTAPTFDGLEDGKTYKGDVNFTVSDNVGVASVSVNNGNKTETLTVAADGKYTLKSGSGIVTVTATDKAGNSNAITVTVNSRSSSTIIQKPTISLGGADVTTETLADGSTVYTTAEGKLILSKDGKTATIEPNEDYEVESVTVNGTEKGAVTTLTGLKIGDKIVVTFKQTADAQTKAEIARIKSMVEKISLTARSTKTAKKNIKITLKTDADTTTAIKEIKSLGYTVKYKYYRSTKKSSAYTAKATKMSKSYTNTSGTKGTKYYYKARVQVYDADGKMIAQTALKQCKYASRQWSK